MTAGPAAASRAGLAWTAMAVGLAGVAGALAPMPAPARTLAVLLFASLGPGAALLAFLPRLSAPAAWALALGASLTAFTGASALLVWTRWWHPRPALVALATATVVAAALAVRARRDEPGLRLLAASRYRDLRTLADVAVLTAALACWGFSLARTHVGEVGDFGLLATIHPAYFAAVALTLGGFLAELVRGARRGLVLGAYLVVLILILHASVPALLSAPQYAWSYKHVGVVELFAQHGQVVGEGDIYQQWPAFFTAVAALSGVGGVSVLSLANWAVVWFNLALSLLGYAVARTLDADVRVAWLSALVLQCVNWIEQDYLAPQALALLLSLTVLLLALAFLRVPRDQPLPRAERAGTLVGIGAVMAVLSATHQLSPFFVAGSVTVLVLAGLIRPWWTVAVVIAIPLIYLAPRFAFVNRTYGILDNAFDLFGNASGNAATWGTAGQAFSALVVRTLTVAVWGLTAVAVLRERHRIRPILAPVLLAILPFGLLAAQSYGGEAIYRVFLFSAPWCAFLIARMVVGLRGAGAAKAAIATVALTAALLATVQGRHGQLEVDRQSAADLDAARYLYAHASPGATIVLATPNFPARLDGDYHQFNTGIPYGEPDLVTGAQLRGVTLNDAYLPAVERFATSFQPGAPVYLVLGEGMRRYSHYFGALTPESLSTLDESLAASGRWQVFYRDGSVVIYELRP